jgi:hypothetical protein
MGIDDEAEVRGAKVKEADIRAMESKVNAYVDSIGVVWGFGV